MYLKGTAAVGSVAMGCSFSLPAQVFKIELSIHPEPIPPWYSDLTSVSRCVCWAAWDVGSLLFHVFSHRSERLKIRNREEKAIILLSGNHSFQLLHWMTSGVVKY